MTPKITVLLCTVRPDKGYIEHPEWPTIGKVVEDLREQTFKDFELVVVDGLQGQRETFYDSWFDVSVMRPRKTIWTRNHRVAISAYRNTGLIHARGELVVNLDDCCELPPNYLEAFWLAWSRHRVCLAMRWPDAGDARPNGRVAAPGLVYGFGSYPLEAALRVNGYDEAYDGGQGLEDVDFSSRLFNAGVKQGLLALPGFKIHPQSAHDPRAVDEKDPIVKCCNPAYRLQRQERDIQVANREWTREQIEFLVGPCRLLNGNATCAYHNGLNPCPYIQRGWPQKRHELCEEFVEDENNWPVFDLREKRDEAKTQRT